MAKFYGAVGYIEPKEVTPGNWLNEVSERKYSGDVIESKRRLEDSEIKDHDINVRNVISIVADPYANAHFFAIKYVRWAGVNWIVTDVEVQSPRLLLSIGGVYRGSTP